MANKSDIKNWLINEDWESLKNAFQKKGGLVRHLMGFLYNPDEQMRWKAAKGFGVVANVLHDEKIKDLLRRMMWSLNDESGTCCWFTPQAIGEIGFQRPELVKDFLPCLMYYSKDPDEMMSSGVRWALDHIAKTGLEIPDYDEMYEPPDSLQDRMKSKS